MSRNRKAAEAVSEIGAGYVADISPPPIALSRRRISFAEKPRMKLVSRAQDLVEDPSELWYQPDEYMRIIKKIRSIVRTIQVDHEYYARCVKEGRQLCTRGLERFLKRDVLSRARAEAAKAVINTQEHLKGATFTGTDTVHQDFCVTLVATVYKDCTDQCVMEALARGEEDAKEREYRWRKDKQYDNGQIVSHDQMITSTHKVQRAAR